MKEVYHGWLIELSSEMEGYSFQCWLPGNRLAVSDRHIYPTLAAARDAAQKRADREAVHWALKHCYANYIQGSLSAEEYATLEDLILSVVTPEHGSLDLSYHS